METIHRLNIGRVLIHITWSTDTLWWNDVKTNRIYYWFHIGSMHKNNKRALGIIIYKLRISAGIKSAIKNG